MPAASVEKRARQRANKVLRANTTTERSEPAVRTAEIPEIVSPPSQSTECAPVLQSPTSSSSTSINFETFIEFADLDDILRFCDSAASTQDGRNLKLLWDRAFEAGLKQGRSEERDFRDEMYLRGKAQGVKEAEEAASNAEIDFYRHGIEKGRTEEQSEWISTGHGPHCLRPAATLSDEGVQTDFEPPITATCDASSQTISPPNPVSDPNCTTSSLSFNWADEATSLPIKVLPSPRPPRDFSDLRSSKINPFSSLRHRSRRFTHFSHKSRRHHSHFNSNSFYSPHHNPFKPSQPHSQTKTYSHLNWESDPRLSDLSRSLRALGWIRAS